MVHRFHVTTYSEYTQHTNNINKICKCETKKDSTAGAGYTQQCHQVRRQFSALFLSTLPWNWLQLLLFIFLWTNHLLSPQILIIFCLLAVSYAFSSQASTLFPSPVITAPWNLCCSILFSASCCCLRCQLQTVSLNTLLLLNHTNWWFVIQVTPPEHSREYSLLSTHSTIRTFEARNKLQQHLLCLITSTWRSACTGRLDLTEVGLSGRIS